MQLSENSCKSLNTNAFRRPERRKSLIVNDLVVFS